MHVGFQVHLQVFCLASGRPPQGPEPSSDMVPREKNVPGFTPIPGSVRPVLAWASQGSSARAKVPGKADAHGRSGWAGAGRRLEAWRGNAN